MRRVICLGFFFFCLGLGASSHQEAFAHRVPYARVIHMILHDDVLEVYINFLLPSGPKMRLWMALFDRDRDGRLGAQEQLALGRYLAPRIVHGFSLLANKKTCSLHLREVQMSRLRGDPQQKKYSWDLRFQSHALSLQEGLNFLKIHLPLFTADEEIPLALFVEKGFRVRRPLRSKDLVSHKTFVSRKALRAKKALGEQRAICRLHQARKACSFWIEKTVSSPSSHARPLPKLRFPHVSKEKKRD